MEPRPEFFNWVNLSWDVAKAKRIIEEHPREAIPQPVKVLLNFTSWEPRPRQERLHTEKWGDCEVVLEEIKVGVGINEAHLPNVNPDEPGIAAYGIDCHILIDGHHRVVRSHLDGRTTFAVFPLTLQESDSCLDEWGRAFLRKARLQAAQGNDD